MAIFSMADRTSVTTINNAIMELIAAAGTGYDLMEVGLTINAATASVFGFGQPAAIGITPTSPKTVLAENTENTSTGLTTTAVAWGTGPTNPTNYQRRISLPNVIGSAFILTFPRRFRIAKAKTLVLQNIIAGSVADVWWVVDE